MPVALYNYPVADDNTAFVQFVDGTGTISSEEEAQKNILFIGNTSGLLEACLETSGYTCIYAINVYEARNLLTERCLRGNYILPDAICCDINMNEQLIGHFAAYLSVTPALSGVPMLLITPSGKTTAAAATGARQHVDDIIHDHTPVKDLLDKIELLKKYKQLKNRLPYQVTPPQKARKTLGYYFSRTIDILFAGTFILLLLPVLLLVALCVKLESRGPILYASLRAGKGYRVFKFYKFRTMVVDADKKIEQLKHLNQYDVTNNAKGPMFLKINNDPRVTRIGKFLRNTSLDELPQLINVLIGDMSLVGNRPLPLYEASSLTIDQAAQRFLAPAGITGLWQIKKRGQPNMSVQERIDLDVNYANQHSFLLDMRILMNTPKVLMQKADV